MIKNSYEEKSDTLFDSSVYIHTGSLDLRVRYSGPPPQTYTSGCPIFKISFDSKNSGKFMRFRGAQFLVFSFEDPLNYYHIFWVKLALYHKCTSFPYIYSKDIQKRKALSY